MLENFTARYNYLKTHRECNGKAGFEGFYFGGLVSYIMAV